MCWFQKNKTFQQLVEERTLPVVFANTGADQAVQTKVLEWYFEFPISDDDETTWLRQFQRRVSNLYPMYEERVRISTTKGNMDPFIVDFMERVKQDKELTTETGTGKKTTESQGSDTNTQSTGEKIVRTPELTSGTELNETRTPDLTRVTQESTSGTDKTITDSDTTQSGTDKTTEEASATTNTKSRGFNVQYPEANLSAVPTDVDNYPTTVDYLSSEADQLGKSDSSSNSERNGQSSSTTALDSEVDTTRSTTGNSTVTDTGTEKREMKSESSEGGKETTEKDGTVQGSKISNGTSTENSEDSRQGVKDGRYEEIEQGRHESVADLLPRAIAAITGTNDLKWFIGMLAPCFDTYDVI